MQIYDLFAEHALKLKDETALHTEVAFDIKAKVEQRSTVKKERRNNCLIHILKLATTKKIL